MSTHDDDDVTGLSVPPGVPPPVPPRGAQLDLFAPAGGSGVRTYLATLILNSGSRCGQCGSREIYVRRVEPHVGAYCAGPGCGRWIRWINAAERARVRERGGDV